MRKARHCRELCKSDWENSYCFELMDYNIDGNTAKVKFEYLAERLREINLDLPIDKVRIVGHYPDDPEGSKLLASLKD